MSYSSLEAFALTQAALFAEKPDYQAIPASVAGAAHEYGYNHRAVPRLVRQCLPLQPYVLLVVHSVDIQSILIESDQYHDRIAMLNVS